MGGHNVPEEVVRRRYYSGIQNFFQLYQPLAESWRFYDNSDQTGPKLIAAGEGKETLTVNNAEKWDMIGRISRQ